MTILDEREPTVSLKLIIAVVSLVTVAAFACMFALNGTKSANATNQVVAPVATPAQPDNSGNI